MVLRQSNEPGNPVDGMTWIDTSGNNVERKTWTGSRWELDVAVGPDEPSHAVEGARWSKTDEATVRVYDGSTWNSIGVTDHSNLNNVESGQHHDPPTSTDNTSASTGRRTGFTAPILDSFGNSGDVDSYGTPIYAQCQEIQVTYNHTESSATVTVLYADGSTTTGEVAAQESKWISTDPSKVVSWVQFGTGSQQLTGINLVETRSHGHSIP